MNIKKIKFIFSIFVLVMFTDLVFAQVELVPTNHQVYDYLKRMQLKEIISDYNSAISPVSRGEIAKYLNIIESSKNLSVTDKKLLEDYKIEFEYDINKTVAKSSSLTKKFDNESLFGNKKQKYLYNFIDTNASLFLDVLGNISLRNSNGDSLGTHSITLGEFGFRVRGTLLNSIGFYLRASNGQKLSGNSSDIQFAYNTDPRLKGNTKFVNENKNFDSFEGNLRYQTQNNIFSVMLGREAMSSGFGYIDKMFLSNNTVPYDFLKLNLNYKAINYSFFYGTIKGDSLGVDLKYKSIVSHRLDLKLAHNLKMGFYESIIISSVPFSFVYFNPLSFLTSADLNTGVYETYKNNTLMGIDLEVVPLKNLALQGTLLIDDINLSSITKNDFTSNDNKFGYQVGTIWTDALSLPNLSIALEYTRLNPFVYSHRSNKDTYTNWDMSLGHALPPNSDEIALKLNYDISNRLKLFLIYQYQRSGEGILWDTLNNHIINYGGNINRGDGDFLFENKFLQGNRVNRNILTANIVFEPIKQYYIDFKYQYKLMDFSSIHKKTKDAFYWLTLKVDL